MITIVGELYSSKNSRRIFHAGSRLVIAKSEKSKAQERTLMLQLNAHRGQWLKMWDGQELPVRVVFKIFRRTLGRFDYTNIVQGLLDAMVAANYFPDDRADIVLPVFMPYEVDPKNPRVEISVATFVQVTSR